MAMMGHTTRRLSPKVPRRKRTVTSRRKKWANTNTAHTAMAMSVAMAAPRMPMSRPKMKMGSRITLTTAPITIVIMARAG